MTVHFPRLLLREKSHSWNLAGVAAMPGDTANSVSVITRSDGGGFWKCSMTDVSLSGGFPTSKGKQRQRISTLLWRAVRQIGNGGVQPIIVYRNDSLFRPWPEGVAQSVGVDIPNGPDDTLFDDETGYYQSTIDIESDAADLRATSLDITMNYAGELMGGESFSIEHPTMDWRLYEIATIDMTSNTTATITFNPPLREAIEAGTRLEFDRPRCKMRLANPGSMDLTVVPWTFNSGSVEFVESP